ncbi:uncharacterized protein LOC128852853 [Cuculus canorus]|uniref:uncharacterized protein LOC128852853 n=1 Tax=Cuculus canorus TaxID=55661 RepID=UPI0023AB24E8|nr:uncharacterized protein LOC128852853 [Cuculus canorus]
MCFSAETNLSNFGMTCRDLQMLFSWLWTQLHPQEESNDWSSQLCFNDKVTPPGAEAVRPLRTPRRCDLPGWHTQQHVSYKGFPPLLATSSPFSPSPFSPSPFSPSPFSPSPFSPSPFSPSPFSLPRENRHLHAVADCPVWFVNTCS